MSLNIILKYKKIFTYMEYKYTFVIKIYVYVWYKIVCYKNILLQ